MNQDDPESYIKMHLRDKCFEFTHTGYWHFQFCPFSSLSQFRFAEDLVTKIDLFVLGRDSSNNMSVFNEGVSSTWGNGDMCVVTKKPRETTVQYICDLSINDEGAVTSISEPNFCNYLVRFNTQYACAFPNVTSEQLQEILCIQS